MGDTPDGGRTSDMHQNHRPVTNYSAISPSTLVATRFSDAVGRRRRALLGALVACVPPLWLHFNDSPAVFAAAAAYGAAAVAYGSVTARLDKTSGYYWTAPLGIGWLIFTWLSWRTTESFYTAVALELVLLALLMHVRTKKVTPAWAVGIASIQIVATVWGIAFVEDKGAVINALIFVLPLVLIPLLIGNVGRAAAVGLLVTAPILSSAWLVHIVVAAPVKQTGVTSAACEYPPHTGVHCVSDSLPELVRLGWRYLISELTDNKTVRLQPPTNDSAAVAVLVAYLAFSVYALRVNSRRLRDSVQLTIDSDSLVDTPSRGRKRLGDRPFAAVPTAAEADFSRILLAGPVVLGGGGERQEPGTGISTILTSISPTSLASRLGAALVPREALRVHLGTAPGSCDLVIEDNLGGRVVHARRIATGLRIGGFQYAPHEVAAYQTLAYCLGARGMPAWASWNADGVGLATWFRMRDTRRARWRRSADAVNQGQDANQAYNRRTVGLEEEISILQDATEREPAALLLSLELSSRLYEARRYDDAAGEAYRSLLLYPQFPENWIRYAAASLRTSQRIRRAANLHRGRRFNATTVSRTSVEWAFSIRGFGQCAQEIQHWHLASKNERPVVKTSDAVRDLQKMLIAALCNPQCSPQQLDALAAFFNYAALGAIRRARTRLLRPVVLARAALVQSERGFFWPLLTSRYGVTRLTATLRSLELLHLLELRRSKRFPTDVYLEPVERMVYRAVEREGTGWRGPVFLAEYYDRLQQDITLRDRAIVSEQSPRWMSYSTLKRRITGLSVRRTREMSLAESSAFLEDRLEDFAAYALTRAASELGFEPWYVDPETEQAANRGRRTVRRDSAG